MGLELILCPPQPSMLVLQGQQRLGDGNNLDPQKAAARRKAREEKARQARQAALQVRSIWGHCGSLGTSGGRWVACGESGRYSQCLRLLPPAAPASGRRSWGWLTSPLPPGIAAETSPETRRPGSGAAGAVQTPPCPGASPQARPPQTHPAPQGQHHRWGPASHCPI